MNLFRSGNFTLNSGKTSTFKIDCDALTEEDIETIARIASEELPTFGAVEGVPTGGLRLAAAMQKYCTADTPDAPLLIVDDVLTTGGSMERFRAGRTAIGFVVFARGECPAWIAPLLVSQVD
jgi:orotate phosphoribosyltransferase